MIGIKISGVAFNKLGFPSEYSVYYFFLSILGSYVNIPVKSVMPCIHLIDIQRPGHSLTSHETGWNKSIAVNLGGAVIPVLMSIFLSTMVRMVEAVIGILVMTIIVHKISKPVFGSGIAIHVVLPPLLAAALALMISPQDAPLLAYISGTIGCLIGVDLLNLKKLPDLGVPAVSIGGSGTFDAIFLTGIISVLLA
ncbi:MAG: DUF1614 domain-containing protein [Candidatus Methanoperedens sp.]|nr:DUF1614 domain-containing protein [Candidatus Methanoperedens sp.]